MAIGERLLRETTGLCARCKRSVPASVWRVGSEVRFRKSCAEHGAEDVLLSTNADWFEATEAEAALLETPLAERRDVAAGCPFDCGPCTAHEQRLHLPVVPITSACNLDCPICYTHNKNGAGAWHMDERELDAILGHLRRSAPEKRILNLTGGEPTQHPRFERILERCHEEGIRRVTISTHGLHLLDDERLVSRLKSLDARVILSFDSFREDVNRAMLGGAFGSGKMRVLEMLERHDVDTTLLPVLAKGLNDREAWDFVELCLSKPFLRSVEFHPMTFTGQSGATFDRGTRYGAWETLADLERLSGGRLRASDFVSSPAAHPLCYQVTYLLDLGGGRWLPFPRFAPRETFRAMLGRTLYLLPGREMEDALRAIVDGVYSDGDVDGAPREDVLAALRALVDDATAPGVPEEERLRRAERRTKAIYVHTHMDEETFDSDRIRQCCVGMPAADGSSIPSCAYNVLYRERDARFRETPAPALVTLGSGRRLDTTRRAS